MQNTIIKSDSNSFFSILKAAMNVPCVKVNRDDFLRRELSKYFSQEIVELAIQRNPASAGVSIDQIEVIAKSCINYETNKVTAISAAAGIPGGLAMVGTVPVDITQYFAHIIRILQKLIYLYGWEELYNSNGEFDDETTNRLTIFIGVMFGVNSANAVVTKVAQSAATKIEKSLANKALTKGIIYPVVKKIAQKIGVNMTKQIFAKAVGKIIPVVGGVISGGLTYATFRPSANRLKAHLKTLQLADVKFYQKNDDSSDIIDVEFD